MSTIERKEYQETKVMRTVSPVRNIRGSNQNLAEFDHNLDYLLEDLQNSVSRPSSSLGTHRDHSRTLESTRSNSLNRFTNVKPSNPVTEYSSDDTYNYTSPDGTKRVSGYKKEVYSYKTSGGGAPPEKVRMQNNINQLDSLLDDLQQVKNAPFPEKESYNNTGVDPEFQRSSKRTVQRELHYGDTPRSSSRSRTLERTEREGSLTRDIQYTNEGTYGDIRQIRGRSPSPSSKTSTLTKQTKVTNVHTTPLEIVETTTPDINPEILAHLDPNLHPPGNTKVTTTIKTYTYEIPGSGSYPTNLDSAVDTEKYVYSPNQTQTTPSKSFVYKKIENKSSENTVAYPPYQKPTSPGYKETVTTRNYQPGYSPDAVPNRNQTYVYNETTTTRNVDDHQPPRGSLPRSQNPPQQTYIYNETTTTRNVDDHQPPRGSLPRSQNPPQQTYIYNETTTTRNVDDHQPPRGSLPRNQNPPQQTYIIEEHHNVTNKNINRPYPDDRDYPRNPPRHETYIIKEIHDTNKTNIIDPKYPDDRDHPGWKQKYIREIHDTNTTTNVHHPYPNGYPPNEPNKTIIYRHETHTTNNLGPGSKPRNDVESFDPKHPPYPHDNRRPNEPVNIQYRYKSESTTTNNYKAGYPPSDESQALLPKPFPTENQPDGPPKRLDELMANIGNEPPNSPYNASYNAHEHDLEQKKKIDTLKRQQEEVDDAQKKEPVQKSKNVSGPPVYYPPGHEMFARKEESGGGAWRAEGGYQKASGKYKYEAESGSKTKSSSGAAIVPVCLPLCCGLPCAII